MRSFVSNLIVALLTFAAITQPTQGKQRALQGGGRGGGRGNGQQGGRRPGNNNGIGVGNNVVGQAPMMATDTTAPVIGNIMITVQAQNFIDISTVITDDDGEVVNVQYHLQAPNGDITVWDSITEGNFYSVSASITPGNWLVRVRAQDDSGNVRVSEWQNIFTSNVATAPIPITNAEAETTMVTNLPDTAAGIIGAAKSAIETLIDDRVTLAAKFLRLGFHDCIGGCDGCVDLANPDNNGLETPIMALEDIVRTYENLDLGVSRADIWALAALTGAESSLPANNNNGFSFPMMYIGRTNCAENNPRGGPQRLLPGPDLTTSELLHFFAMNFGFDARQTVAIMGAHTLGEANRRNSGFNGQNGWVRQKTVLNNEYYEQIVGGNVPTMNIETLIAGPNWNQVLIDNSDLPNIPDQAQWVRGGGGGGGGGGNGGPPNGNNNRNLRALQRAGNGRGNGGGGRGGGIIMMNVDISLVRNFTGQVNPTTGEVFCEFRFPVENRCPHAQATLEIAADYKFDNGLWLEDFRDTLSLMLQHGYTTPAPGTCVSPPCALATSGFS